MWLHIYSDMRKKVTRLSAFGVASLAIVILVSSLPAVVLWTVDRLNYSNADKKAAKTYVEIIKPRLESFRRVSGHYPDSLKEIAGLPPIPSGLTYKRELDPYPSNPDTYRIDYDSLEYWSNSGQWFDDD